MATTIRVTERMLATVEEKDIAKIDNERLFDIAGHFAESVSSDEKEVNIEFANGRVITVKS